MERAKSVLLKTLTTFYRKTWKDIQNMYKLTEDVISDFETQGDSYSERHRLTYFRRLIERHQVTT